MANPQSDETRELTQAELEKLYTRMEAPLYNVVFRRLWDPADAQDVVQEAFLSLWRARARVRLATVEPLLYRTALNLAAKRRRSRRLWRWIGLEAAGERSSGEPGADEALAQGEREARLRRAVDGLPEKLARVLLLTEISGLSHAEVGAALGIPAGTVASRRHLAFKRLGLELGGAPDESP